MRILINTTYYYPHWTGLTQYAKQLAEGLAERGHEVTVITTRHQRGLKTNERIEGVEVIRTNPSLRFSRSIVSAEMWLKLVGLIANNDCVIGFLPLNEALWLGVWARWLKKRLVLVHNGDLMLPKGAINRIIEAVFYLTSGWAVELSDRTVAYTNDYAQHSKLLRPRLKKCVEILPPVEKLKAEASEKKKVMEQLPDGTKQVVGFAGRFVEEKGFDILLKAMGQVVKQLPNTKFVFAGETKVKYENCWKENQELIEANKNNVVWMGLLDRKQMGAFYAACDLFVLSSRSECFGLVQAEAMLAGVPVVVTNIPGARWLVKQTGAGIITPPENSSKLAEAIVKALKNISGYKAKTYKAKKIFERRKFLDRFVEVLTNE